MSSKTLRLKIIIGIALAVVLLMVSPFKTAILDNASLEANAHVNNLIKSSDSFLLSAPVAIVGRASEESREDIFRKTSVVNESLDAWFDRSQTQALIVQKKGRIIYQRYSPDADDGRRVNAMSMTKAIVAILIGIAIDEGLINSETDSISQYLPQITQPSENPVTIRDLLRHTSGIESASKDITATLKGNSLITSVANISFNGDRLFRYDNINYHLLSMVLTNIYKQPLNQLIENKLWQPLKLDDASVINTAGYCCMFATARSWLEIGNLFLNPKNHIVSSLWLEKMVKDSVIPEWFFVQATGKSVGNAYGYHIYRGLPNTPEVFWIEGMGLQLIMVNPQTETMVVRLGGIPSILNVFSNRHDDSIITPLLNILMSDR